MKRRPSQVTIGQITPPGTTTVVAVRGDAQLTLLTAISAFADSIPPLIITKDQTYENISWQNTNCTTRTIM
jgi:hypothetical protein